MCIGKQLNKSEEIDGSHNSSVDASVVSKLPEITREELKSHNYPSNAWCAVHNQVLDISKFARRHPGGDLILLAAGSDATVLFETYHPRGVPASLVNKLKIGELRKSEQFESYYSWNSAFYPTLKKRVVEKLDSSKVSRRGGDGSILVKGLFIMFAFWYCLYQMCVSSFNDSLKWSAAMGFFASFIGTCIQHDGNHGAFSNYRWLNKAAGWTLDMIGASGFTWEIQHMLGHHPYTNVLDCEEREMQEKSIDRPLFEKDQECDPDVFSSFPLLRMHPAQKPSWYQQYQHMYAPFLFALMTVAKVLQQDFELVFSKRLYHIDATCRYGSKWNVARFWFMKVLTMAYMIGLPVYFHSSLLKGCALFLVGHFSCGEMLATMFIVNHVIEGVAFGTKNHASDRKKEVAEKFVYRPKTVEGVTPMIETRSAALDKSKSIEEVPLNDWAAVQCQTSVNWSSGSWFWNHFSGGLSHQIGKYYSFVNR